MHLENRLSSAIFPNRGTAERAAQELRRIGLSNIRLSEAHDAAEPPTFAAFVRDMMARLAPGRAALADGGAPLGKFERSLVEQGIPSETASAVSEQLRAGATLLTVRSGEHTERAMEIMRSFHAVGAAGAPAARPGPEASPATPPTDAVPAPSADAVPAPSADAVLAPTADAVPAPSADAVPAPSADAVRTLSADAVRTLSADEMSQLAVSGGATMIERLQAMGGLTVRKVTVVERRQIEVELRREDLVVGRETAGEGGSPAGPSEIRIPLSHEEVTIGKRVVLAEWQSPEAGPAAAAS